MCGIVGRINAAPDHLVDAEELRRALRRMVHRGPDGEGIHVDREAGLGHLRLAIVDVAGGAQPMSNPEQSIWVTFNGEIYNYQELRDELQAMGFQFRTRSDTEVLIHGYQAWRDGLTARLRGMFVFAIWDARARRMLMARDRVGIKPLYWTLVGRDLVFASEVKSLLAFRDVRGRVDPAQLPLYLALRYVPGPSTMWRGIERLQPGHQLVYEAGRITKTRYWDVPVDAAPPPGRHVDERAEAERLLALFDETVRMHMMGEVPVGLFLSGGIDSTAVGWAMRRAGPAALKTFSVGFDGDSEGELSYARIAAEALGAEHREVRVTAADFAGNLDALAWHLDEPLSDGACIPLMLLAKRAREEVVVVLSGEGADELLAGYDIYGRQVAIEWARQAGTATARAAALALRWVRAPKLRKYLDMARKPLQARYFGVGRAFADELLREACGESALEMLGERLAPYWARTEQAPALHRMLYNDTKIWLPDDLLIKADKMTMAWSIELRVPFLDHRMIEHAWSLPIGLKRRHRVGKYLLRRMLDGRIPDAILHRPKKGFPVPLSRWLRGVLHGPCREELLSRGSLAREAIGPKLIERLLTEHRSARADRTEELYTLWILTAWHRAFLAKDAEARNEAMVEPGAALGEIRTGERSGSLEAGAP